MDVLVAIGHHFWQAPDGGIYPEPPPNFNDAFWRRYLEVFEEVVVLARVRDVSQTPPPHTRADGPGIRFFPLADFRGAWQYVWRLAGLKRLVREAVEGRSAFILRAPDVVSFLVWEELRRLQKPFAVEVIADPWDLFAPHSVDGWTRPFARRVWAKNLARICAEACAISYVTRERLQQRYPPRPGIPTFAISSGGIGRERFADEAALAARFARFEGRKPETVQIANPFRLGFVGMVERLYKAPDVLLQAFAICLRQGWNLRLDLLGDGRWRARLEQMAARLGIAGSVRFLGALEPGPAIFRFLDEVDLFVLPSRQEGLPRAMIEAMARGCPCIGSTVGGIPELLPPEDTVPPGDAAALARKIGEVLSSPTRMHLMARRNLETAVEYAQDVLAERRKSFYATVRRVSQEAQEVAVCSR